MYRFNNRLLLVLVLVAIFFGLSGCMPLGTKTTGTPENPVPTPAVLAGHEYGVIEVSATMPVPTVAIQITPDALQGWNLQVSTTNFRFAPEHASSEHYPGEGHAHLYIDSQKIARLYDPWYHIKEKLTPGQHVVTVTLNSNDHNAYAIKNQVISATMILLVEP